MGLRIININIAGKIVIAAMTAGCSRERAPSLNMRDSEPYMMKMTLAASMIHVVVVNMLSCRAGGSIGNEGHAFWLVGRQLDPEQYTLSTPDLGQTAEVADEILDVNGDGKVLPTRQDGAKGASMVKR